MPTIKVSEEQYSAIMKGMEFYQRFLIGQPDGNSVLWDKFEGEYPHDEYDEWKKETKKLFFPELQANGSYGCSHTPLEYEIWREMKYQDEMRRGEDDTFNVYKSETLFSGKYPKIEVTF